MSTIGTATLAAGGAIFSSTFFLTRDFDAAFTPFILTFIVGLFMIVLSIVAIIRYDGRVIELHEHLLEKPFGDLEFIEGE